MNKEGKRLIAEIFKKYTLDEILKVAVEQNMVSVDEAINSNDTYKSNLESIDDICLRRIRLAFQEVEFKSLHKNILWGYRMDLPEISEVMNILRNHYDDDDILDTFYDSDLLEHIEDSNVLEEHDEEIRADIREECENESYIKKQISLNELSLADSDTWWRFVCDIIGCSYYDYNAMQIGIEKLKEKLNKSTYAQQKQ